MSCHPERNLARFLRQMESKDLRFRPATFSIYFWDDILARYKMPWALAPKGRFFAAAAPTCSQHFQRRRTSRRRTSPRLAHEALILRRIQLDRTKIDIDIGERAFKGGS